jgi:hypothetical protein
MRLLVLDDGLITAQLLGTLADAGHEVFGPVSCLEKAMALAIDKKPQLALLGVNKHGSRSECIQRLDELSIPTMFLIGCKVGGEEIEKARELFSDPNSLNVLLALVEYIQWESCGMPPEAAVVRGVAR